ncbi:7-cyano-7-deazaguanine synthase [Asanoa siamensis]
MHHVQRGVIASLASVTSRAVVPLRYRVNLPRGGAESSQRTRGLLFLSAGVSAALATRCNQMIISENGIGSINLPYVRSQLGAQATRSMHPNTIALMEVLVSRVIGSSFEILAPYRALTKAELLAKVPQEADVALTKTVSCDTGFAARVTNHSPCGRCTSCLLRRQSIYGAGRHRLDAGVEYRYPAAGSVAMSSMLWQVMRLRECLASGDPWQSLAEEFPEILFAEPHMTAREIVRLYQCYTDEWDQLVQAVSVGRAWSYEKGGV